MMRPVLKPREFCCAPQAVPTDISHFQKSVFHKFKTEGDTMNGTQEDTNRKWNTYDSRKQTAAEDRERNLERAIIIGALLIIVLVAVVFYWKFAALGNATGGSSDLGIQTITHY
jgi:preprotein translocase subunit SecF